SQGLPLGDREEVLVGLISVTRLRRVATARMRPVGPVGVFLEGGTLQVLTDEFFLLGVAGREAPVDELHPLKAVLVEADVQLRVAEPERDRLVVLLFRLRLLFIA